MKSSTRDAGSQHNVDCVGTFIVYSNATSSHRRPGQSADESGRRQADPLTGCLSLLDKQPGWKNTSKWHACHPPPVLVHRSHFQVVFGTNYNLLQVSQSWNTLYVSRKTSDRQHLNPTHNCLLLSWAPPLLAQVCSCSQQGIWWRYVSSTCHNSPAGPLGNYATVCERVETLWE